MCCESHSLTPPSVTGKILVDGRAPDSSYRRLIGYVEQTDMHFTHQTVLEAIECDAQFHHLCLSVCVCVCVLCMRMCVYVCVRVHTSLMSYAQVCG